MSNQIALYSSGGVSPFVQRVEIALQEAGVDAVRHEIGLYDATPAWFKEKINPEGKIPAITYGPPHPIDQPAPNSVKLNESLIIVEFIADLYPQTNILPKDPMQKAKARVFAAFIDSVLLPAMRSAIFAATEDMSALYKALDLVQSKLPDNAEYAAGDEFSVGDIAAAPLFGMLEVLLSNDIGKYRPGEGLKAYEVYNSTKYDKLHGYAKLILARESSKKCIHPELMKEIFSKRLARGSA